MISNLWAWLTSAENWAGSDGIAARLVEHLWISGLVVLIAAAIAIPLGLWVGHTGRGRWLVSGTNAARAVPTLGLLFALALWVGPIIPGRAAFVVPSIIALVLLAIPPIVAGTYAGVEAVDPAARDAAAGVGMRPSQVLWQVEVPCALPLVLSGARAATLQVIATATIAAAVSLGGLGRYLIDGLAVRDYPQMAGGAVVVASLALAVDLGWALLTRYAVSPGLTGRSRPVRGGKQPPVRGVGRHEAPATSSRVLPTGSEST